MSSLDPLVCCRCEQPYTFARRMITRSCGHSFCETCENQIGLACAVCPLSGTRVPFLDIATLVCAGCGEHYARHDRVINQVRILDCGHRAMCQHSAAPVCAVCGKTSKNAPVDVTLTAIICRVGIRYPDVIREQFHKRRRGNCWDWLRRRYAQI